MDESATIFLYRVNMPKDKAASSHLGEEIFIVMYYLYGTFVGMHIEEGQRQMQMQRSSLLFGGQNLVNSLPR